MMPITKRTLWLTIGGIIYGLIMVFCITIPGFEHSTFKLKKEIYVALILPVLVLILLIKLWTNQKFYDLVHKKINSWMDKSVIVLGGSFFLMIPAFIYAVEIKKIKLTEAIWPYAWIGSTVISAITAIFIFIFSQKGDANRAQGILISIFYFGLSYFICYVWVMIGQYAFST